MGICAENSLCVRTVVKLLKCGAGWVGFYRPEKNWNVGKKAEFGEAADVRSSGRCVNEVRWIDTLYTDRLSREAGCGVIRRRLQFAAAFSAITPNW